MKKNTAPLAILYYQHDVLVPERNHAFDTQRWLYRSRLGSAVRTVLKTHIAARCAGWFHNTHASRHLIASFIEEYRICITDFVVPPGGYKSFNDFFIRALQPDVRPMPDNQDLPVSPADGKLFVINHITPTCTFFVKELPFDLVSFLGNDAHAQSLNNGTLCMFRLAPYDYHRFHTPCDGTIEKIIRIAGTLESVNPIAFMAGKQPLTSNERIVIMYKTQTHGTIAIVAVGALFVGSITLTKKQGEQVHRGDELGYFAFGGSTVVVIFPAHSISPKELFLRHSLQGYETAVTIGTAITD